MATVTAFPMTARMRADRLFYAIVPAVAATSVFTGFARSWFLRPALGQPPHYGPLTALLIVHGLLMTSWMAINVTQPLLITVGNRSLHRTLGCMGATIAALIVLLLPIVTIHSMRGGGVPAFPTIYVFAAVNVIGILAFAITVALIVLKRNRAETHKRLALLSLVPLIPPALGRTPGVQALMPLSGFGGADLVILAGILFDWRTRGRVHRVWKVGGALTLLWEVAQFPIGFSAPWIAFGNWAMRLPV